MSEHFTIAELTDSQIATRKNIPNTPSQEEVKNLVLLIQVLEQIRTLCNAPITISSGYRSKELNKAVGGASNSAHCQGLAADISCNKYSHKTLAQMISSSGIKYDQCIYEGNWVHIGLSLENMRQEDLTATFNNGVATYTKGFSHGT